MLHQVGDNKHGTKKNRGSSKVQNLVHEFHKLHAFRNVPWIDDRPIILTHLFSLALDLWMYVDEFPDYGIPYSVLKFKNQRSEFDPTNLIRF